jgi:hypothetical protein
MSALDRHVSVFWNWLVNDISFTMHAVILTPLLGSDSFVCDIVVNHAKIELHSCINASSGRTLRLVVRYLTTLYKIHWL